MSNRRFMSYLLTDYYRMMAIECGVQFTACMMRMAGWSLSVALEVLVPRKEVRNG